MFQIPEGVALDIVMFVPGLPMDENTLAKGGLGGSETAGLCMAKSLAGRGHKVTLFCNTEQAARGRDDVMYMPLSLYAGYAQGVPHDVHIAQRAPEAFASKIASRLNILWCHDLAQGRDLTKIMGVAWNIDKILVLSRFMRDQYASVYGDAIAPALHITRNALDPAPLTNVNPSIGANKRLFYSARPERGLDNLLNNVMPALWDLDPTYTLAIAGYDNPVAHMQDYYRYIAQQIERAGPRVKWLGALSKRRLYEEMSDSSVYVYPSPSRINERFEEVYCISAIEAQACGLPVVATRRGALPEVVKMGDLLDVDPWADGAGKLFAQSIIRAHATTRQERESVARIVRKSTWDSVALEWEALFRAQLQVRSDDPFRTHRWFWRTSDIMACDVLIMASDAQERDTLLHGDQYAQAKKDLAPFAFMHATDGYRKQYETIGAGHDTYVFETARTEMRFKALRDWLLKNPHIKTVLDYGCAHGAYAIGLAEDVPHVSIVGVDIDKHSIAMAQEWAAKSKAADRLRFVTSDHEQLRDVLKANGCAIEYDCVLAQEVLEHVPAPWATANSLQRFVKPGGTMYMTVPFGPWEFASYRTYPHRCHIWHFDQHDLRDMFGHQEAFRVQGMPHGGKIMGEAIGWWVVSYEMKGDIRPCRPIDMERKLALQAPRQTLSATIIAGGNTVEDTLGWCLRSLEDVADEIVIGDAGMSRAALEIAERYGARVIKIEDPKRVGFENARNAVLDAATCDWVLWIDTDERLIDADNLHKYLRENSLDGYGIRQHHFAIDAPIPPDTPVRLFRRRSGLRFFGAIHEHPEKELNKGPGTVLVLADVNIGHVGYVSEAVRRSRFTRNLPLLDLDIARYPDRLLQKHFLIRDHVQTARMIGQQSGGRLVPEAVAHLNAAIDLYKTHFLGQPTYSNADSLMYVSEALAMLGRGIEVSSTVVVAGQEIKLSGIPMVRYESQDDYIKDLSVRVGKVWAPLTAKHY